VECQYCHAIGEPDDRRCTRCGHRLLFANPRPAPEDYTPASPIQTSTAPALDYLKLVQPLENQKPEPKLESLPGGLAGSPPDRHKTTETYKYQPSLFRDMNGPKVVPIPTLTPLREPSVRPAKTASRAARSAQTARRNAPPQRDFEFHEDVKNLPLEMQVEVIYCDAPVALPAHRIIAAAVDLSLVLVALGVFLGIFFLSGGEMVLNRQTVPFLLGVAAVISLFYRFLWCIANGDTPGMRFAGLRLVDFDGRAPDRDQRGMRQVASILSLLSAGLGLVWALVDEESLTWHDHISKTFPTPG
jgi:uncharacterized RDD family membrane protein YckC